MVDLIELPVEPEECNNFLVNLFPNFFAEALIPVNPQRWLGYLAGSISTSEMTEFNDKVTTPFNNLLVAKEYLETSQSDVQWRDRFWNLMTDTAEINSESEVGSQVGAFGSGARANKIADG